LRFEEGDGDSLSERAPLILVEHYLLGHSYRKSTVEDRSGGVDEMVWM